MTKAGLNVARLCKGESYMQLDTIANPTHRRVGIISLQSYITRIELIEMIVERCMRCGLEVEFWQHDNDEASTQGF